MTPDSRAEAQDDSMEPTVDESCQASSISAGTEATHRHGFGTAQKSVVDEHHSDQHSQGCSRQSSPSTGFHQPDLAQGQHVGAHRRPKCDNTAGHTTAVDACSTRSPSPPYTPSAASHQDPCSPTMVHLVPCEPPGAHKALSLATQTEVQQQETAPKYSALLASPPESPASTVIPPEPYGTPRQPCDPTLSPLQHQQASQRPSLNWNAAPYIPRASPLQKVIPRPFPADYPRPHTVLAPPQMSLPPPLETEGIHPHPVTELHEEVPGLKQQLKCPEGSSPLTFAQRVLLDRGLDLGNANCTPWLEAVLLHGTPRGHHRWLQLTATQVLSIVRGKSSIHRLVQSAHTALSEQGHLSSRLCEALGRQEPIDDMLLKEFRSQSACTQGLICMGKPSFACALLEPTRTWILSCG